MARRGRFAKQTGGSNISQLVWDLMRAQFNRQASAMSSAYFYSADYRGGGVPSASDVLAFLNEYKSNTWITQYERDQIDLEIAKVMKEEAGRRQGCQRLHRFPQGSGEFCRKPIYSRRGEEQVVRCQHPTGKGAW
jgi:hypothetical protein